LVLSCKKYEPTTETSATTYSAPATAPTTSTTATGTLTDTDKDFVTSAGKGGKAEVEVAQDAVTHATNADVKAFAQQLVQEHTKANDELTQLASTKGVTIPGEVESKMKEAKERLMKLTGKSFDQAFLKQMVDDHTSTIKSFEDESKAAADPDIKKFAENTLPTLREHLKKAKDLQAKVGKGK
jgi:putative membrane protein